MYKFKRWAIACSVGGGALLAPLIASATAPTYITDAITAAGTSFTDGLTGSVTFYYTTVTALAVVFMVAGFIKKALKGR